MSSASSDKGKSRGVRIGKYEVLAHIASGGMAAVYRARDVILGREVALKVLVPEQAARPGFFDRFRTEARTAARLQHENIVALYECGEAEGTYFLALEYVDGIDLHDYVLAKGKLDPEEARQLIIQAARALDHAHSHGIIHRDIKPANFLVTQRDGRPLVKLIDLGLAREASDDVFRVTRAGSTVGTIDYMAPEQARNSRAADVRSDIYSLGCTFHHLLTGQAPFARGSLTERLYAHLEAPPPDLQELNPAASPGLAAILARMLAKRPEDRFQTPGELLDALEKPEPETQLAATGFAGIPPIRRQAEETPPGRDRVTERHAPEKTQGGTKHAGTFGRWSLWAACAAVAALVGLGAAVILSGEPFAQKEKDPPAQPRQAPGTEGDLPKTVYPVHVSPDPNKVRIDFTGPLVDLSPVPDGPIYRICRLPARGSGQFASLAEALADIPDGQAAVLEIHDNGPLFEPSLPDLGQRRVLLRPGKGFRPLLAWDVTVPINARKAGRFLALGQGSLALEDLDVVVTWPGDTRAERPGAFCHVGGGVLTVRGCTFSVAGKHPHGTVVARLEGGNAKCRLSRCFLRGSSMTALDLQCSGAEVLLDDCLVVGEEQPLCLVSVRDGLAPSLRLLRSTLVCGKTLLEAQPAAALQKAPGIYVFCCDSILARNEPAEAGTMVRLNAGVTVAGVGWKARNCVYAGWRTLVQGGDQTIAADLQSWRRYSGVGDGDKVLPDPWPENHSSEPEDVPATTFATQGTGAYFKASTTLGPVGCEVTALPPGRARWQTLTYHPYPLALPLLPAVEPMPTIRLTGDGRYHGERLTLTRDMDLGRHLKQRLAQQQPGPRIVLHLSGSGEQPTSPIRLRGAALVLYFEKPRAFAEPLTLVPGPEAADKGALVQVEDGDLEILGGRITLAGTRGAPLPRHALQVTGGNLRLADCQVQGPLTAAAESFQGLIAFAGADGEPVTVPACAVSQSILLSGRAVFLVRAGAGCLRLKQCLALASDDLLVLDQSRAGAGRGFQVALENSTFGFRRTLIEVQGDGNPDPFKPVVLRADASLFLSPFEGPAPSTLLRCEHAVLCRGNVLWQGKGNAYDRQRLHQYVAMTNEPITEAQQFSSWAHLWGASEQAPLLVDLPKTNLRLSGLQLRQLALPASVRPAPGQVLPGADLALLGIVAAKK
jgi:serine/threonine protein kinase